MRVHTDNSTVRGLVISGFGGHGIVLDPGSDNNVVQGNFIGTDATGQLAKRNSGYGLQISQSSDNRIGGLTPESRNVISGNGAGLQIAGTSASNGAAARNNVVQGNFIGPDVTGRVDLGNQGLGVIIIAAAENTIGGVDPGARNIISGNSGVGIGVQHVTAHDNLIQGNFIGTDVTGTVDLGNSLYGISISGTSNMIGGTVPGARNVISGNDADGIAVDNIDIAYTGNIIQGNLIGTDVSGSVNLGNSRYGVSISFASNNMVGGTVSGAGNTIAFNGAAGILVTEGPPPVAINNAIRGNSIFSNTGLGIDHRVAGGDGVTLNDPGDTDTGANNLQNFPVLTSVLSGTGTTMVRGTLESLPQTTQTIEFFGNTAADSSNYGEGQTFLGSQSVTTDSSGLASFVAVLSAELAAGQLVTATATDSLGNTSEFSRVMTVTPALIVNTISDTDDGVLNTAHTSLREAIGAANARAAWIRLRLRFPAQVRTRFSRSRHCRRSPTR